MMFRVSYSLGVGLVLGIVAYFFLFGCAMAPPYLRTIAPQSATLHLASAPDATYQCAVTVFAKQPTVAHLSGNPTGRAFTGEWHHAVQMAVTVEPDVTGSLVTIQGSVPRSKMVVGEFTEVTDLTALLKEQCS